MFSILNILSKLPLSWLYTIARPLSWLVRAFYRRKLVTENLSRCFPEKDDKEIKKIASQFYKNFTDVTVEILKAQSISRKEIDSRVHFVNPELTFELQQKNKPLLFFASHHCNWEWMAQASGVKLSAAGDVIYKPLRNKKADEFGIQMRSRFGGRPISKNVAAREILKSRNEHRIIGLVADQAPPREHVHWAYFFGQEADFYPGLLQLPYLMQAKAVFGRIIRTSKGHYEVELVPIGEPPYAKGDTTVLERYIEETERLIRDSPEDYLWTHNRWKHTRTMNEEMINFSKN